MKSCAKEDSPFPGIRENPETLTLRPGFQPMRILSAHQNREHLASEKPRPYCFTDFYKIRFFLMFLTEQLSNFESKEGMTPRMNENLMKALFLAVMFMVLLFQSFFSSAQSTQGDHHTHVDGADTRMSTGQTPFTRR